MWIAFTRWLSGGSFNRPSPRKRLLPKKKTSSGFEFVSGLADGASAMPAKWSKPVFSFGFYEDEINRALIVIRRFRLAELPSHPSHPFYVGGFRRLKKLPIALVFTLPPKWPDCFMVRIETTSSPREM